ncbi:18328_t:CDS:2 [Funneliformis geosporum]|uniref:18328_t:CDS:1 n=1 Tax=Funneliformis geosporum TaxID=1117311 RepID=A0A9W4WVE7_9GLOM|nr:18328_t:CDS:2 [Funneliformis geosporum]
MNGSKLEEFAQEYSVNCTLYRTIITTNLDHECIVGYNLGQIHPEMVPETLINEVFWDIPEKKTKENVTKAQENQKRRHNLKIKKPIEYQIGDQVLLYEAEKEKT